jgi:tripartite-type tricarboxylate transporter receptor subunit TctC
MQTRRGCVAGLAGLATVVLTKPARSQDWPQRPVKIIVPFAAGGHSDGMTRIVAQRLGETFGQQFVVENRPGAAGVIAAEVVARAPADGHTLFMGSPSQIAITPAMTKTPYDPVNDFAPISNIGAGPFVLAVHSGIPANTVGEFVEYVRRQPRKLTFISSGVNGMVHLATTLFLNRAGLDMIPVSYKGGTAPVTDVIAGHVDIYFAVLSVGLPHATNGALKLLAVTGERRASQIPHIPTFIESGFPGFKILTWNGLMAPAGTPKEIIDRIAKEVSRAAKDPKFVERLSSYGVDPLGNSPEEFAAMIAADIALWAEAVKIAGVPEK